MIVALLAPVLTVLITLLVGLLTVVVIYARWHYGTLEKVKGLPAVVKPAFVGGSDIYIYKKVVHEEDSKNVQKYGKMFGYYEGRYPHIYIADPELIRFIFVKDFDHFHNKRIIDYGHELFNEMMDILPYDKWKVVRNTISPTLSSGKIRNMSMEMSDAIESWIETVIEKQKNGESFTPRRLYMALSCDVIARCAFGLKINSLHDPNNMFIQQAKDMVAEDLEINFMLTVSQIFHFLARFDPAVPQESLSYFNNLLLSAIKARKESNQKIHDFVGVLNEMMKKLESDEYKNLKISQTTIMCQAIVFFLAGFETTSSALTYLTLNLAKNPDVQEKLVAEVDEYLARHDGKITHETIGELIYMQACIQESLRMYSPAIRIERVCNKDWNHEPTGLHIPKDMVVQVPIYAIHYNEEYYPDPYSFKPERFLPENKDKLNPYAFLAFGQGNHNCIGMRFAKEEINLTMAHVLKHFTFKPNAEAKVKFMTGRTFLISSEPFTVDAIKRQK